MTGEVTALVVDDEALARADVVRRLRLRRGIDVLGEARDGIEAVARIRDLAPQIVFLDVQMPGLDGFAVLQALAPEERPVVVFATAHDEFALAAFDARAADYLLKPFDDERFAQALERALVHVRERTSDLGSLLDDVAAKGRPPRRLAARCGSRMTLVDVDEVQWIESARNYVLLHTMDEEHLMRSTMTALLRQLDPATFVRVHRSHVVRLAAIRHVERRPDGEVMLRLRDGRELPVGPSHRRGLERRLAGG